MRIHVGTSFMDDNHRLLDATGTMERARKIEAAGLDGIWMGDAVGHPRRTDPLTWLLVQACAAPKLEVGTCILVIPLREPVDFAQRILTINQLTRWRYTFGVGTGGPEPRMWGDTNREDEWPDRFKLMTSVIQRVRSICRGDRSQAWNMDTFEDWVGEPRIMIGAYASSIWVKKAAREFDGWIGSASRTNKATTEEAIKRFRDAGGKRAAVCSIFFNLGGERKPLRDDEPFNLECSVEEAADRLAYLADLGYDDVILPKRKPGFGYYEPTITDEELQQLRSLLPKDTRPKPWEPLDVAGNS